MPKNQRGGSRPNSGRKPLAEKLSTSDRYNRAISLVAEDAIENIQFLINVRNGSKVSGLQLRAAQILSCKQLPDKIENEVSFAELENLHQKLREKQC